MPVPSSYENLWVADRDAQRAAYTSILSAAGSPVDWAYEVWDDLVAHLSATDNHDRSIAAQILSRLAKSDPEGRMQDTFGAMLNVTRDKRFVTARHSLQALWEIGLAGQWQRELLLGGLRERFSECSREKNCTLIRYDIVVGLRRLFDETSDDTVRETAEALIETEPDDKYRKKYASAWR